MSDYTIYSEEIWERMLEKYPRLRERAAKCGVEHDPQKAKSIRKKWKDTGSIITSNKFLTDEELHLAMELGVVIATEQTFLDQMVFTGKFHLQNGAIDHTNAIFELILSDFEASFNDWYKEIRKRNISSNASFEEMYTIFLDIIKLKIKYKIPYTKLFVRKLLEMSANPKADSFEIEQYFRKNNPEILSLPDDLLV